MKSGSELIRESGSELIRVNLLETYSGAINCSLSSFVLILGTNDQKVYEFAYVVHFC